MPSPSSAVYTRGAIFRIGDGGSPETFQPVAEVRDIQNADPRTREFEDVTNQDSPLGSDEFFPTLFRGGTLNMDLNWLPLDGTQDHLTGLRLDFENGTLRNFQIHLPGSGSPGLRQAFAGYIESFPFALPHSGVGVSQLAVRISGGITTEADN